MGADRMSAVKSESEFVSEGDLIIAAVPATMIELVWDRCVPHLEKVIRRSHGEITLETVKRSLISGKVLLVTISRGTDIVALNTIEVRTFDSGKRALYIPITGGAEMDKWLDRFLSIAKAIAKDHQCTELRGISVRKGWMRKLAPKGWVEVSTVISCPLDDEEV